MKKILQILMASALITACNSKSDLDANKVVITDTSALYKSNMLTDTGSVIQTSTLPKNTTSLKPVTTTNHTTTNSGYVRNNNETRTYSNSNTNRTVASRPARRRGWSHAAKDATIGGVGGAVTGAVISKNHGKGAIIGGVLGAAGGYIIGHGKDKREGR